MHTCDPQTQEAEPDFPVIHTGIVLNYWELAKFIDGILNMKVGFSESHTFMGTKGVTPKEDDLLY